MNLTIQEYRDLSDFLNRSVLPANLILLAEDLKQFIVNQNQIEADSVNTSVATGDNTMSSNPPQITPEALADQAAHDEATGNGNSIAPETEAVSPTPENLEEGV